MDPILIRSGDATCRISIGRRLVAGGDVTRLLPDRGDRAFLAVLTQPATLHLAAEVADAATDRGLRAAVRVLPDREDAKTLGVVEEIYHWLNDHGTVRSDTVLALGGGALTDVAGFVAATYLRGIEAAYVPTTLLAAVDAAVGGKTGVNVGGKNLAGTFTHPTQVTIDLDVLDGLPEELIREGAAEAVKAGFIADGVIVDLYEEHGLDAPLDVIVPRAVMVKADVVNDDFGEKGHRAILNYGHTIGHALEVAAGLSHGHAVSVGMVAAAHVAQALCGFLGAERQRAILEKLGLPTSVEGVERSEVEALMALDKKRTIEGTRMVLLEDFGRPTVMPVDTATVVSALAVVGVT